MADKQKMQGLYDAIGVVQPGVSWVTGDGMARRGAVRVSGGPTAEKMRVEVFDGAEWLTLRCVSGIQFSAEAGGVPRLILHIEAVFLDTLNARETVALEVVGAGQIERKGR